MISVLTHDEAVDYLLFMTENLSVTQLAAILNFIHEDDEEYFEIIEEGDE